MTDRYPSIDKPWLQYYSAEAINSKLPECTVYENIWKHNKDYLSDIAINYYGNKITYQIMFKQVEAYAKALKQAGVKKGSQIALCTAGTPESIYIVLAASRIGATANFINPLFTEQQMIDRINETECELFFVLDKLYQKIKGVINQLCIKRVVIISATDALPGLLKIASKVKAKKDNTSINKLYQTSKYIKYRDFIAEGKHHIGKIDEPYEKDRTLIMVYSSGTTGASKGIELTNDGINATIHHYGSSGFEYQRGDSMLQIIPVWFSTGIVLSMLMPLCYGITVILEPVFSNETFTKDMVKYRPEMTVAADNMWNFAVRSKEWSRIDLSNMKYPISGGEKILPDTELLMNSFLKIHKSKSRLLKGYGMCELGSTITTNSLTHNEIGSTGFPILNVSVASFDIETNEELPYGKKGEIRVLSAARMRGYYKNPKATEDFFFTDANGHQWGCTGDIGYIEENGDVFVLGRKQDCFQTENGEKAFLFDIEDVILRDSAIVQCKVVDVVINGKTILLAHLILSKDNDENAENLIKRINNQCKNELEDFCVPYGYRVCDQFPVHPNGKCDNQALRDIREGFVDGVGERIIL